MIDVGVYRVNDDVKIPERATHNSACFDFCAYFGDGYQEISGYRIDNKKRNYFAFPTKNVTYMDKSNGRCIEILPGERVLVPTGMIFDIPEGYSLRIHARSGLALKNGITLANGEGVVDSDYINQVYIMLTNLSSVPYTVINGDRIAQGEIVRDVVTNLKIISTPPEVKTNRVGGFGSTG